MYDIFFPVARFFSSPLATVFSTDLKRTWSQVNVASGFLENGLWKVKWQAFWCRGSDQNRKKWCFSKITILSTGNPIVNFKRLVFEEFSSFSCSGPTPYTKMLVISLSINRFPKIRMLSWPEITSSNPSRKRSPMAQNQLSILTVYYFSHLWQYSGPVSEIITPIALWSPLH